MKTSKQKGLVLSMRKWLSVWFAFCMAFSVAAILLPNALAIDSEEAMSSDESREAIVQDSATNRYAKVATAKGTLNMRAEPKDKAKILNRLPKGTIIRIVDDNAGWMKILYKGRYGYAKASFLEEIKELPYSIITEGNKGDSVLAFKRALHRLGYLKSGDINTRFDVAMEIALTKLQLLNGVELNPKAITPELQALMEWGMLAKGKSGYVDTAADKHSGLMVSIFCWDSGGTLYDGDQSVKVKISYAAQATGGQPPYIITVKKSLKSGGEQYGDVVSSPFSHIWSKNSDYLYLYAIATDSIGNTATACASFRYALPSRYTAGTMDAQNDDCDDSI